MAVPSSSVGLSAGRCWVVLALATKHDNIGRYHVQVVQVVVVVVVVVVVFIHTQ